MDNKKIVRVGAGVYIKKGNKYLLGKRINAHGEGTWCPPGGHLEFGENFEECVIRETLEEAGIKIKNIRFGRITNDIFAKEEKHYITIHMFADFDQGEVKVMEPHKCEKWEWFLWNEFPESLFIPVVNLKKGGYNPF
jgi:8-oxo-dGTP diphosphatase